MSAPFVTELRSRRQTLHVGPQDGEAITIRVEMPEVWDVVAISVSPSEPVVEVKKAALGALFPEAQRQQDFMFKLKGWEVLNEHDTLGGVGVVNGSILLLTHRRRRPVR